MSGGVDADRYLNLFTIVESVRRIWPAHEGFLSKRFGKASEGELLFAERMAGLIVRIKPATLDTLVEGYKWTCGQMMYEEAYFRKNGRYRQSDYDEVNKLVYSNADFMGRYLSGLLLSQLLWLNHFQVARFYHDFFLANAGHGSSLIEIGPGHGLLLALASAQPEIGRIAGVDISAESIARTSFAVRTLGLDDVELHCGDMAQFGDDLRGFDMLVCSEVLEHLEDPVAKLAEWSRCVKPDGVVFVNVPINSPAPDHIYLLRNYKECADLVEKAGLCIETVALHPATGLTLHEATIKKSTISCVIVGRRVE